jgi:hypothetical protein
MFMPLVASAASGRQQQAAVNTGNSLRNMLPPPLLVIRYIDMY